MIAIKIFTVMIFSASFDLTRAIPCTESKTGLAGECKYINECPRVLKEYQTTRVRPTICDSTLRTICCPIEVTATVATSTQPPLSTTTETPARISVRKCREYGQLIFENVTIASPIHGEPPINKRIPKCSHEVVPLIVGGEEAREREFPHMALVGFGEGNVEDYQCGGSLISENWVLSAAHCVTSSRQPANWVKLGNVVRTRENMNSYTYRIIERIPHPSYNSRYADDDIALFKLQAPVIFNTYVIPVCLPDKEVFTTKRAIAIGYGKTDFFDGVSDGLMKVVIEYFNRDECDSAFAASNKFINNEIDWKKTVCAGSTNRTGDTCQGDSGGPLQIYNSDVYCMYNIIGVTSFGYAYCGIPGVPAIYTKVYNYLDWIESIVWPNQ